MLLACAAVLVGVVVALLLVPISVELRIDVGPGSTRPPVRVAVGWAVFHWRSGGGRARKHAPPPRGDSTSGAAVLAALRTPGLFSHVRRLLRRSGRSLLPKSATVRATIGLDDPAQTGMLAGALAIAARLHLSGADCRVRMDFLQATFSVRAEATWSLRPAVILGPLVIFLLSPVVWRAARAARRG
jgi:hypothetical protein